MTEPINVAVLRYKLADMEVLDGFLTCDRTRVLGLSYYRMMKANPISKPLRFQKLSRLPVYHCSCFMVPNEKPKEQSNRTNQAAGGASPQTVSPPYMRVRYGRVQMVNKAPDNEKADFSALSLKESPLSHTKKILYFTERTLVVFR